MVGLKVNINTKDVLGIKSSNDMLLTINGHSRAAVNIFRYLGSVLSTNEGAEKIFLRHLKKAHMAFAKLRNTWRLNNVITSTRCRILKPA